MQSTQQSHITHLDQLYAGLPLPRVFVLNGNYGGYYGMDADAEYTGWVERDLPGIIADVQSRAANAEVFNPPVIEFIPLGVHYVDALFGARVNRGEHAIWSELLPGRLADLAPVEIDASPLWQWTARVMVDLLTRIPQELAITGPIFSSPLNVAINLFGEEGVIDILEADAGTLCGLDAITDAIAALHRALEAHFPTPHVRFYCSSSRYAPDGMGHICGCSTQLLGPDAYASVIAPLDDRLLHGYPHGGTIHLCGRHTQHIPCWRAMPSLRGVQLNDAAADDFPAYFHGLRDDQIIYLAPTERMTAKRILAISEGRRVVLQMGERPGGG